jgi:nitrous oxidase accessory protein NosD
MATFWQRHRPQLVSGLVGLGVGVVVVGGVWIGTAVGGAGDPGPAATATKAAGGGATTGARATPTATPKVGVLDEGGGDGGGSSATGATAADCGTPTTTVRSASELEGALSDAAPGDVIVLADGTYSGEFEGTASGTASDPIALCGGSGAVIDGGGLKKGYAVHLDGASYWTLSGFTVRNSQKGVVLDDTQHSVVQELTVEDIGDEGIHLRANSSDNTVRDNSVTKTGLRKPQFGEGIYIGSSESNWCDVSDCQPDKSDRNVVTGNKVFDTAAENVDIKEGTTAGVLSDNSFDGTGMQGQNHADSWVDVKGNDWKVTDNTGVHSPLDGFQTHELRSGWGTGNTFSGNTVDLGNSDGVAFAFRPVLGNTVSCGNHVEGSNEFSTTKCTG